MELLANISWCMTEEIEVIQNIISTVILIVQIAIPILLIIFGMIDLGKAIVASKEDDIKKGQSIFIKRLITAIIVFLVIWIVKVVVRLVSSNTNTEANNESMWNCVERFISGPNSN
ncbi:MAG: hypothetical protein NC181_00450 [Clostridium sp.]|nr:hypothetical protein [Clostridium sp.]MCM1443865.1 hypothetical protein [Candidatus Amulumruptor caecigallinarius]